MAAKINRSVVGFSQAETDRVRALALASLSYDPATGVLTWKSCAAGQVRAGDVAGSLCKHKGYVIVSLENRRYRAHRLIWLMVYGHWPYCFVDHKNLNKSDNRLDNLREADRLQNSANSRVRRKGLKGCFWMKKQQSWYARLGGKHLGSFKSEEEAHAAFVRASIEKFGEFARAA